MIFDTAVGAARFGRALEVGARVLGAATTGLGVVVLFGWHTGNTTLIQVLPAFVAMQYNTALGFVACGAALIALATGKPRGARAAGGAATLLGILTLVQYVFGVDLGIDELLMEHDITVGVSNPGRMAPNTAVCFTLIGLACLVPPGPRGGAFLRVTLSSLAFGLGVVALAGYVVKLETAYGWGNLTRMAVHTSVGFILVSIGVVAREWGRDTRQGRGWLPAWIPVPIGLGILTAAVCVWQAIRAAGGGSGSRHLFADLVLVSGGLLAMTMALIARAALASSRHVREMTRVNRALERENRDRQMAESRLQQHQERLEELVEQRTREMRIAREEAEAANHAKSQFLSSMSHELRTPLNGVLGYAQILLREGALSDSQRRSAESIRSCGEHLLELINDVLDLSKIESGALTVAYEPTDLPALLEDVMRVVTPRALSKGLEAGLRVAGNLPRGVRTDPTKLRQVLINLLGNAAKFTERGEVALSATREADTLRFEVRDTGVGIPADKLEEVFDPFRQVDTLRTEQGTGLGLAISRRIVEAMGGAVDVTSEVGVGSCFTFTLPCEEVELADGAGLEADREETRNWHLEEGQDIAVLIADDVDTNRDVLDRLLRGAGFRSLLASDGREALELAREHRPPLAFLDLKMPEMDGFEACQRLRADPDLAGMTVVAITASVFPDTAQRVQAAGFDEVVGKPFQVSELLELIRRHLGVRYAEANSTEAATAGATAPGSPDGAGSMALAPGVAATVAARIREAVELGDVQAVQEVAEELGEDSTGQELLRRARDFDFTGIADLADRLEGRGRELGE